MTGRKAHLLAPALAIAPPARELAGLTQRQAERVGVGHPLLAPTPAQPPKLYRVTGNALVHGHAKGEQFEAALAPHEESLLIESGHIERADESAERSC